MPTDFNQFIKHWAVKLIAFILTFLIIIVVAFGLFTNKHIKIWFVEFNGKEVVIQIKKDTVYVPQVPTAKIESQNNTETKSTGKNSTTKQNNKPETKIGDVKGKNIAIGDNNKVGDTYYEKSISETDMATIANYMESENKRLGVNIKCFRIDIIYGVNNDNAPFKLKEYLIKRGYEFKQFVNITMQPFQGATVDVVEGCFSIRIGTL